MKSNEEIVLPHETLLREKSELVYLKNFKIMARVDLIRIPTSKTLIARESYFDAIVVENVMCKSTTEAFKIAKPYKKKSGN